MAERRKITFEQVAKKFKNPMKFEEDCILLAKLYLLHKQRYGEMGVWAAFELVRQFEEKDKK